MPIPPATKRSGREASSGSTNVPFDGSTSTSAPRGSSASERLKALSRRRVAESNHPALARCRDSRDVPALSAPCLNLLRREEQRRRFLLGRILVEDDYVDERRQH